MNHKQKLLGIYSSSANIDQLTFNQDMSQWLNIIVDNIESYRGVYTVLITMGVHKTLYPLQDIRYHQDSLDKGFSGRSVDEKYITPTLKELGLPNMAQSGWLTRSLEQPYPYTLDYPGKIRSPQVKKSFLEIINTYQAQPEMCHDILRYLLHHGHRLKEKSTAMEIAIKNGEEVTIDQIVDSLEDFFSYEHRQSGISKVPVIAVHSMYSLIVRQVARYKSCSVKELASHTSSDQRSHSSGDIEVIDQFNKLLETVEVKYDIDIDTHIVNRAKEKIKVHRPKRYYILSTSKSLRTDTVDDIGSIIAKVREEYGCQIVVNGLVPTLKYYLRLVTDLKEYVSLFTTSVLDDRELKISHKEMWRDIVAKRIDDKEVNIKQSSDAEER